MGGLVWGAAGSRSSASPRPQCAIVFLLYLALVRSLAVGLCACFSAISGHFSLMASAWPGLAWQAAGHSTRERTGSKMAGAGHRQQQAAVRRRRTGSAGASTAGAGGGAAKPPPPEADRLAGLGLFGCVEFVYAATLLLCGVGSMRSIEQNLDCGWMQGARRCHGQAAGAFRGIPAAHVGVAWHKYAHMPAPGLLACPQSIAPMWRPSHPSLNVCSHHDGLQAPAAGVVAVEHRTAQVEQGQRDAWCSVQVSITPLMCLWWLSLRRPATPSRRGVLPRPGDLDWPAEPLRSRFLDTLKRLEMPRFTRRHPELLLTLMRHLLQVGEPLLCGCDAQLPGRGSWESGGDGCPTPPTASHPCA